MFFFLSKLLDVFLTPYTWGLLLLALAVPWRGRRRGRYWRRKRVLAVVGFALLVVFAMESVSNRMLYRLEHASPSTYRPDVTYDAVILLGGVSDERVAAETGQSAYNDNVDRLVMTHRLLAEGRARFAIISGAAMSPALIDTGEARVLARQIAAWGIDPARVIIEEKARNTRENAVYSQSVATERGFKKVLVVTSAFHMRRAVECFEAVGMEVDTLSADYRAHSEIGGLTAFLPRAGSLAESTVVLREIAGLYIYRLQGYAKPRPDPRATSSL